MDKPVSLMVLGYVDPMWGRLSIDREALTKKLAEASEAVHDASITAQYRTDEGYPINSAISSILGGLSQVLDGLLEQLDEQQFVAS